jgi:hypothetical protein
VPGALRRDLIARLGVGLLGVVVGGGGVVDELDLLGDDLVAAAGAAVLGPLVELQPPVDGDPAALAQVLAADAG